MDEAVLDGITVEPQGMAYYETWRAWLRWRSGDAGGAIDRMVARMPQLDVDPGYAATALARMAIRAGRADAMEAARRVKLPSTEGMGTGGLALRAWLDALIGPDDGRGEQLLAAARQLEAAEYRYPALEAYTDAVVELRREGAGIQEAMAAIVRLMRTTHIQPMFGAPPEATSVSPTGVPAASREAEAAAAEA